MKSDGNHIALLSRFQSFCLMIGLLLFCGLLNAQEDDGEEMTLRSVNWHQVQVPAIFRAIEAETGVRLVIQANDEFIARLPRFNMVFDEVPISVIIRLVCADGGLEYRLEDGALAFYPDGQLKSGKKTPKRSGSGGGTNMTIGNVGYYPIGYKPPKLAVVNGAIVYCGPVPIFRRYQSGISVSSRPSGGGSTGGKVKKSVVPPSHFDDADGEMRLNRLVLPRFAATNETLEQVIDRLRADTRAISPERQAINIYVSVKVKPANRLTFDRRQVSSADAVRFLAKTLNLNYRIEKWGVIIY